MGFVGRFRIINKWCFQNPMAYFGSFLIVLGILSVFLKNFLDGAPAIQDLKIVSGYLSEKPSVSGLNSRRSPVRGWVKLGSDDYLIKNIYFLATHPCRLPRHVRDLKIGDRISILTSKSGEVWQIKKDKKILLSYHDLMLANQSQNHRTNQVAHYFFGIGGLLILVNAIFKIWGLSKP